MQVYVPASECTVDLTNNVPLANICMRKEVTRRVPFSSHCWLTATDVWMVQLKYTSAPTATMASVGLSVTRGRGGEGRGGEGREGREEEGMSIVVCCGVWKC